MKVKFCICGCLMEDRKFFYFYNLIEIFMALGQIAALVYAQIIQMNPRFIIYGALTFIYMIYVLRITFNTFMKGTRLNTKRNQFSSYIKIIIFFASFYGKSIFKVNSKPRSMFISLSSISNNIQEILKGTYKSISSLIWHSL